MRAMLQRGSVRTWMLRLINSDGCRPWKQFEMYWLGARHPAFSISWRVSQNLRALARRSRVPTKGAHVLYDASVCSDVITLFFGTGPGQKSTPLCGRFYRTTYPVHWDSKRAKPAHRGSPMNRSGIALTAIVVLAFLPVCARAQTASITGTVKDATGAVVPQTRITAQNVPTNAPRTVVTDDSGIYRITNLAPGTHDVLID